MLVTLGFLYVYFFPTILARTLRHVNWGAVFFINLATGWTIFGWFCALVWAFDMHKEG